MNAAGGASGRDHRIRLGSPATVWTEALPLGNGHLAAMCFADPGDDRFALNHDTLWSGSPRNERARGVVDAATARAALAQARSSLAAGDRTGADDAVRRLQARYGQAFLPLGDLRLGRHRAPRLTWRELDLATAVHTALAEDGTLRRSYVSAPDGVLVVETTFPTATDVTISVDHPLAELGRVVADDLLELRLRAPSDVAPQHEAADPPVSWSAEPGAAVQAVLRLVVVTDGRSRAVEPPGGRAGGPGAGPGGGLVVHGATRLRVLLACGTTFRGIGQDLATDLAEVADRVARRLDAAARAEPSRLLARHVADHAALYDRVELTLPGADDLPGADERSRPADADTGVGRPDTAARLAAARAGGTPASADPALAALLVHYGRYLLIASSRAGSLPATLQGCWNEELRPPWSSSYTVNINTQMNYWGAETAALTECHDPLADLVAALARNGAEVASRLFGTRGWVAHHNADAWAFASPVGQGVADPAWAFWPMAGPWLVAHLADRLRFAPSTARRVELATRTWPLVAGAVAFLRDWVVELEPGVWGCPLSTSPENVFAAGVPGRHAGVARHAAMDAELVHDVATRALELAAVLTVAPPDDPAGAASSDAGTAAVVREARWLLDHVALPGQGADGGVAEWFDGETPVDPHHRHVSMLYGTFPGCREQTGRERAAAARSLDLRGDDSTGWSLVWKAALRARLGQGARVQDLLDLLLRDATAPAGGRATAEHGGLYPNLFAAHPPFQIDGNLGLVGAALECLVQSHRREGGRTVIELLPALPPAWSTGAVRGLRTRAGLGVDLAWTDGLVDRVVLISAPDAEPVTVVLRGGGLDTTVTVPPGDAYGILVA